MATHGDDPAEDLGPDLGEQADQDAGDAPEPEWTADLFAAMEQLLRRLDPATGNQLANVIAVAHDSARRATQGRSPTLLWPMVVTLLAYGSTLTRDPALATGLVEASRAHAAAWMRENQIRAFTEQVAGL